MTNVCLVTTQRGRPNLGNRNSMAGYRYEPCHKPATIEGKCKRHYNLQIKFHQKSLRILENQERSVQKHDSGSHDGYEYQWSRQCWKCGQVLVSRKRMSDAERKRMSDAERKLTELLSYSHLAAASDRLEQKGDRKWQTEQ